MIKGLIKNNVNVIECHENLWEGIEDRLNAVKIGLVSPKFWIRIIKTYYRLFKKFKSLSNFDVIVVGYPGQFDVFFAKLFTIFRKKPIVWDVFMSIYLVSLERNLHKKNPISVKFLKFVEYIALRIPNKLIIDTQEYADWFNQIYKISTKRFCFVPTGADEDVFFRDKLTKKKSKDKINILYYGTFIPNHGVPFIIEAAKLLEHDPSVIFQFIGTGPEVDICTNLINDYELQNVELYGWMEQEDLKEYINEADIILGAFGKTPQSLMTVQNKIFEGLSMSKLVLSGESQTVRNHLIDNCEIILCDRDDPSLLADKILELKKSNHFRTKVAENGHRRFINNYSISKLGEVFLLELKRNKL